MALTPAPTCRTLQNKQEPAVSNTLQRKEAGPKVLLPGSQGQHLSPLGSPPLTHCPVAHWLSLPGPLQFLWSPSFPSLEQIQWVQMAQMYERLCHLICRTSLSYMCSYWAPERQLIRREDEWLKKSWELTWSLGHFGVDLEGLRHIATAHMKHYKI